MSTHIEQIPELCATGDRWSLRVECLTAAGGAVTYRVHTAMDTIDDDGPVHAMDYYEADTLDLARAIANAAEITLRAGRRPLLHQIAQTLKRRDPSRAGSLRRTYRGGVILGDTPLDELAELKRLRAAG